ncbi:hypothetical protein NFI96_003505 [Prochilodus magdalenae]|nr:hypothetical protein NFI96_003505 [Prochilodus magdalenae]
MSSVQAPTGNVTFSCSEPAAVSATFLSSSSSFLQLPAEPGDPAAEATEGEGASGSWSAGFQFRTWNRDGLLLWSGLQRSERLLLLLSDGQLRLTHYRSAPQSAEITVGQGLSDGQWHSVMISLKGLQASVSVDNEPASSMLLGDHAQLGSAVLFGGCSPALANQGCRNPTLAYQGCLRAIVINNHPIDLYRVQQGLLGNYSELQIDICGIRDRLRHGQRVERKHNGLQSCKARSRFLSYSLSDGSRSFSGTPNLVCSAIQGSLERAFPEPRFDISTLIYGASQIRGELPYEVIQAGYKFSRFHVPCALKASNAIQGSVERTKSVFLQLLIRTEKYLPPVLRLNFGGHVFHKVSFEILVHVDSVYEFQQVVPELLDAANVSFYQVPKVFPWIPVQRGGRPLENSGEPIVTVCDVVHHHAGHMWPHVVSNAAQTGGGHSGNEGAKKTCSTPFHHLAQTGRVGSMGPTIGVPQEKSRPGCVTCSALVILCCHPSTSWLDVF